MYKLSRFAGVFGCVAALGLSACAGSSGVAPATGSMVQPEARGMLTFGPDGSRKTASFTTRLTTWPLVARRAARFRRRSFYRTAAASVQVTPTVFLITWGYSHYGDRQNVKALLQSYFGSMGGSGHNNVYTQYFEDQGSKTVYITNPSNQYGGAWEDDTDRIPSHPTDAQVAAEALKGVAHFGYNANASYVVATAHGHSTSGFATQWCAYHSATSSHGSLVSYTDLPYMPDGGANCGANIIGPPSDETAADEGVTIVQGHEQGESVTDPNPPYGWYNYQYGEIGDICAWQNIQNDPFGSHSYTMQPMFSNATQSCVHSYP